MLTSKRLLEIVKQIDELRNEIDEMCSDSGLTSDEANFLDDVGGDLSELMNDLENLSIEVKRHEEANDLSERINKLMGWGGEDHVSMILDGKTRWLIESLLRGLKEGDFGIEDVKEAAEIVLKLEQKRRE